jgi:hypothetical protein
MKQWGQSQASVDGRLLGLQSPYHQHVISTFNTCSQGPTHRSLTDTGRSYSLGGADTRVLLVWKVSGHHDGYWIGFADTRVLLVWNGYRQVLTTP